MAPARKPPTATAYKGTYNSTSTGHQVGNGVSKPAAYHKARAVRLQEQFGSGSGSGSGRKRGEQQQTTLLKYFGGAKAGAEKKKGKKEVVVRAGDVAVEAAMAAAAGEDTAAAANAGSLESRGRKEEGEVEKKVLGIVSAAGTNITTTGASPTSAKAKAPLLPPPLTTKLPPPPPPITTKLSPPITTKPPQIFAPLTIHISGPTTPHISDHTLKRLLCAHGARIAATVSQRTTTHVVLGCGGGGALAAGKLQREVARRKGTVRFVGVAWALDSIKAGRRLPEGRYAVGGVGRAAGQRGVAAAAASAAEE